MISSLVAWLYLLKDLGLDIHYSVSQFMWDNITVDIVPNGYWTKSRIPHVAKTWNANCKSPQNTEAKATEELHLVKILPADYKPVTIEEGGQQTNSPYSQ
jgi:hypothetical protein